MSTAQALLEQRATQVLQQLENTVDTANSPLRLTCLALAGLLERCQGDHTALIEQLRSASSDVSSAAAQLSLQQTMHRLEQITESFDQSDSDSTREGTNKLFEELLEAFSLAAEIDDPQLNQQAQRLVSASTRAAAILSRAHNQAALFAEALQPDASHITLICQLLLRTNAELSGSSQSIRDDDFGVAPLSELVLRPSGQQQRRLVAQDSSELISLEELSERLNNHWWYVHGAMNCITMQVQPHNQALLIEVRDVEDLGTTCSDALDGWQVRMRTAAIELSAEAYTVEHGQTALTLPSRIDPTAFSIEWRRSPADSWRDCFGSQA